LYGWQTLYSHQRTGLSIMYYSVQWSLTSVVPVSVIKHVFITASCTSTVSTIGSDLIVDGQSYSINAFTATPTVFTHLTITSGGPTTVVLTYTKSNVVVTLVWWVAYSIWNVYVTAPNQLQGTGGLCTLSTCPTTQTQPGLGPWAGRVTQAAAQAACTGLGLFGPGCLLDVQTSDNILTAAIANGASGLFNTITATAPQPCANGINPCAASGGNCAADPLSSNGYTCTYPNCPAGMVGGSCQWPSPCGAGSTDCLNGAHCSLVPSAGGGVSPFCTCTAGFTGLSCGTSTTGGN